MAELVFGPALAPSDLDPFLLRHGISGRDATAIRRDFPRLLVYRTLARGTLRSALELAIPRTMARLGPLFDEYFARFLTERGPRTHYLRDVTTELLDFCAPLWPRDPRVPAWALDLARHEALSIVVASSPDARATASLELAPESCLVFSPSLVVARYEHAVHRLPENEADRSEPVREPTALAVYRDANDDVRYLELSPLAATMLDALLAGAALGQAVVLACESFGVPTSPSVLDGTSRLLADLSERGALLGVDPLSRESVGRSMAGSNPDPRPR